MAINKNKLVILVDCDIYSLDAVYGASYVFLEKAYIRLQKGKGSNVEIILKSREPINKSAIDKLGDEFMNELLNFSLKSQIAKNNKKIREYIVGRALASALPRDTIDNREQGPPGHKLIKQNFIAEHWDKDMLDRKFKESMDSRKEAYLHLKNRGRNINNTSIKESTWEKDSKEIVIPWAKEYRTKDKGGDNTSSVFIKEPIWEKDPKGIAIPWKKKHKIKKNK